MTSIEPEGTDEALNSEGTEPQQQLAQELEEIAAQELTSPDDGLRQIAGQKRANGEPLTPKEDQALRTLQPVAPDTDETVVLYDKDKPENETSHEQNEQELIFERNITKLQQQVVGALVEFYQRAALINKEAQGEESLAVDPQFARVIINIREQVIERVPELADQCWEVGSKAREHELQAVNRLDETVAGARGVLLDAIPIMTDSFERLKNAVKDGSGDRVIDDESRTNSNNIANTLKHTEKGLVQVPRYYGEVVAVLQIMLDSYAELMKKAKNPLDADEQDKFRRIFNDSFESFGSQMAERTKYERGRIDRLQDDMHTFYSGQYAVKMRQALDELGASTKSG